MAITQYYVDPSINANSGTGTIGDAFGDLQYALNTVTRNSTDGDVFNVKAGTSEVLAASLTLATYGTPTEAAPLIIRGYTSTAGDGGIAEIDCGGVTFWNATNYTYWVLADLKVHNFGNNHGIDNSSSYSGYASLVNCEIYKGASSPSGKNLLYIQSARSLVLGCNVHDAGTSGKGLSGGDAALVAFSYFNNCASAMTNVSYVLFNVISVPSGAGYGISFNNDLFCAIGNSIYSAGGTGIGIDLSWGSTVSWGYAINNIVQGFSGTGGKAVSAVGKILGLWGNAYYNNATNESLGQKLIGVTNSDTLAASPFTDAANFNFAINGTVAGVTEDAYPASWGATTNKADKGAAQAGAGTSTSGGGPVFGGMVVR